MITDRIADFNKSLTAAEDVAHSLGRISQDLSERFDIFGYNVEVDPDESKQVTIGHVDRAANEAPGTSALEVVVVLAVLVIISIDDHCALVLDVLVVDGHVEASRDPLLERHQTGRTRVDVLMSVGLEEEWHAADRCQTIMIPIYVRPDTASLRSEVFQYLIQLVINFDTVLQVSAESLDIMRLSVDLDDRGPMECQYVTDAHHDAYDRYIE